MELCHDTRPRHGRGARPRHGLAHGDTRGLGAQAGQAVHLVHPTSFWTQCTVSVNVLDHCS